MQSFPSFMRRAVAAPNHQVSPATSVSWRSVTILLLVVWVIMLLVFRETAMAMVQVWLHSQSYNHGVLILPLSLYVIWHRRHRVIALSPTPHYWGLLLVTGLSFGWLLSHLAHVAVVQQFALVAMLVGLCWTVCGSRVFRVLLFPFLFLFFAVPFGEGLVPFLQDFTASFTVMALRLSGIAVYRDGWFLETSAGKWHVAEACSGMHYVTSAVVLGSIYAAVTYHTWRYRVGFVVAMVVLPILLNGIRAYTIVLLTQISTTIPAAGVVAHSLHETLGHQLYGGIVFSVFIALMFWLGRRWRDRPSQSSGETDPQESQTLPHPGRVASPSLRRLVLTAAGCLLLVMSAPVIAYVATHRAVTTHDVDALIPPVTSPWKVSDQYTGAWHPRFVGADELVSRSFTTEAQTVHVHIAYYKRQRQGAEIISGRHILVDGQRWEQVTSEHVQLVNDNNPRLAVSATLMLSSQHVKRLVWKWYWVGGTFTVNPYWAKVLQVYAQLFGRRQDAAVIVLGTDYRHGSDDHHAAETLRHFLHHAHFLVPNQGRR